MPRTCPWCCEPLPWRARRAATCPHCERPLRVEEGAELRPVDLRCDEVVAAQRQAFLRLLQFGLPVAAVVALLMPFVHLAAAGLVPLLVVVHLVTVRLLLVGRGRRLLGSARRLFNRWISRLSFLWLGVPGYGLAAVPVVGVLAAAVTFAGLTALVHQYTLWSLERERQRLPLALWEKLVLILLAVLTVVALAVLVVVVVVVGLSVAWLAERLRAV
jgi:hypothetical protein